jgi:hypothetical protein
MLLYIHKGLYRCNKLRLCGEQIIVDYPGGISAISSILATGKRKVRLRREIRMMGAEGGVKEGRCRGSDGFRHPVEFRKEMILL